MTSTPKITFRRATKGDVVEIVRMLSDDDLGSQRERFATPLPECYYNAFEDIDASPGHELIVAEIDGAVVGTLQFSLIPYLTYRGGRRAQIEAVRVDANHRGEGIGAELFRWAIARARETGCHLVQLTTDKKRPEALNFYEGLGFRATHEGMKLHLK